MIAPLMPYAIRGAIWYQGEGNRHRAYQYRTLLPAMIANWRADWGQGDFPFGIVQLAPFRYGGLDPANWAELCEAQRLTLDRSPNNSTIFSDGSKGLLRTWQYRNTRLWGAEVVSYDFFGIIGPFRGLA